MHEGGPRETKEKITDVKEYLLSCHDVNNLK